MAHLLSSTKELSVVQPSLGAMSRLNECRRLCLDVRDRIREAGCSHSDMAGAETALQRAALCLESVSTQLLRSPMMGNEKSLESIQLVAADYVVALKSMVSEAEGLVRSKNPARASRTLLLQRVESELRSMRHVAEMMLATLNAVVAWTSVPKRPQEPVPAVTLVPGATEGSGATPDPGATPVPGAAEILGAVQVPGPAPVPGAAQVLGAAQVSGSTPRMPLVIGQRPTVAAPEPVRPLITNCATVGEDVPSSELLGRNTTQEEQSCDHRIVFSEYAKLRFPVELSQADLFRKLLELQQKQTVIMQKLQKAHDSGKCAAVDSLTDWLAAGREMRTIEEVCSMLNLLPGGSRVNQRTATVLKAFLGPEVDASAFSNFLKLFGPMRACMSNFYDLFCQDCVHLLTVEEAERMFAWEKYPAYMVRLDPLTLSVALLPEFWIRSGSGELSVEAVRKVDADFVLVLKGFDDKEYRSSTLAKLVRCVSQGLNGIKPLDCELLSLEAFHGLVAPSAGEKLLATMPAGMYIVRFSQSRDDPALFGIIARVDDEKVLHTRVTVTREAVFDSNFTSKTVAEFLTSYKDVLKAPFSPNRRFDMRALVQCY